jgi:hypothetical protein
MRCRDLPALLLRRNHGFLYHPYLGFRDVASFDVLLWFQRVLSVEIFVLLILLNKKTCLGLTNYLKLWIEGRCVFANSLFGQVRFLWLMYTCYFRFFFCLCRSQKMFSYLLPFIGVPSFNMLGFFIRCASVQWCNACAFLYSNTCNLP